MSVYGTAIGHSEQRRRLGVIGEVSLSMKGNTILRVGHTLDRTNCWEKTEHVVLTPGEREQLISDLIAQRS